MSDDFVRTVAIPACQGAITGIYAGLLMLAVCIWQRWPNEFALVAGCMAALVSWGYFLSFWHKVIMGMLLPQPEWEPAPKPIPTTRIELTQEKDGYYSGEYIDLNCQPDQLRQLAEGIEAGKPLTIGVWTGAGAPFTRPQFEQLRAELIRRNLAVWRNPKAPQQGFSLTVAGVKVIRKFAASPTHPPSKDGSN